jgi:hypothetical protein
MYGRILVPLSLPRDAIATFKVRLVPSIEQTILFDRQMLSWSLREMGFCCFDNPGPSVFHHVSSPEESLYLAILGSSRAKELSKRTRTIFLHGLPMLQPAANLARSTPSLPLQCNPSTGYLQVSGTVQVAATILPIKCLHHPLQLSSIFTSVHAF